MSETKKKDRFLCGVDNNWVTMFNNDKLITINTDNKARDGKGSISIVLGSSWLEKDCITRPLHDKIIRLDSAESLNKLWTALMAYDISQVDKP